MWRHSNSSGRRSGPPSGVAYSDFGSLDGSTIAKLFVTWTKFLPNFITHKQAILIKVILGKEFKIERGF